MYATRTSGTAPIGPVSKKTGRSFMPGTSPNGNWAKKMSPGRIHRLPVLERVDVLPWILQFIRPFPGKPLCPCDAATVLVRQQDDQAYRPGGKFFRYARLKAMLVIYVADQLYGFH